MATQVASLFGVLSLKDDQFRSGMQNARSEMHQFGDATKKGLAGLDLFASNMALISAPILAIGAAGLKTASDFDASMRMISARTGLVGEDLQQIADYATQMGATTIFSAQEASDAFLQLLSSGQSAEQAISTLPAVLNLAAASGEDLGHTADVLTDIMAAYGLAVSDATYVTDVLARAAGASSADVGSLGQGFSNVSAIASTLGVTVYDTASALAILSENGIKGAEAGTALKSALLSMSDDTNTVTGAWKQLGLSFYDANNNAIPLPKLLADIKTAMVGMSDEEQNQILKDLAGSYGYVALGALTGSISMQEMSNSMMAQADAATIAQTMMGGFGVTVDSLKGSFETLMINALTPLMNDHLTPLMNDHLIPMVNKIGDWAKENPKLATSLVIATGAVSLFGVGIFAAVTAVKAVAGAIIGLVTFAFSPLGLAIALGIGLVWAYQNNWKGFKDFIDKTVRPVLEELLRIIEEINRAVRWDLDPGYLMHDGTVAGNVITFDNKGSGKYRGPALSPMDARMTMPQGPLLPMPTGGRIVPWNSLWGMDLSHLAYSNTRPVNPAPYHVPKDQQDAARQMALINQLGINPWNPFAGFSRGGFTGYGASGQVAGMVHRNEYVVPEGGALVMRGGGGSSGDTFIIEGDLNVNANSPDELFKLLRERARRR